MFIPLLSEANISRAISMAAWANQGQRVSPRPPLPGSESRYAMRPTWGPPAFIRSATGVGGEVDPHQSAWQALEAYGLSTLVKSQGIGPGGRRPLIAPDLQELASVSGHPAAEWTAIKEFDGSLTIRAINADQLPVLKIRANSSPGQPPYFSLNGRPIDRKSTTQDLNLAVVLAQGLEFSP